MSLLQIRRMENHHKVQKEVIHIALTIDENYVRYCTVVIASVLENNKEEPVVFHVVANGLSAQSRSQLTLQAAKGGSKVFFYAAPSSLLCDFQLKWGGKRLSMTVFYRCVLATILPDYVKQVIYMDCDVLVLQSLRGLWNTRMEGYAMAGVQDLLKTPEEYFVRLGYDRKHGYVNGGVLLLNLDYWRNNDVENRLKKYFKEHTAQIVRNDQDIMNAVLIHEKIMLDFKWNVQIDVFGTDNYKDEALREKCLQIASDIGILHYCYRKKPWHYNCIHPLRELFFEYERLTPFDDYASLSSPWSRVHRFMHNLPYTIGLKKSKVLTKRQFEKYRLKYIENKKR